MMEVAGNAICNTYTPDPGFKRKIPDFLYAVYSAFKRFFSRPHDFKRLAVIQHFNFLFRHFLVITLMISALMFMLVTTFSRIIYITL